MDPKHWHEISYGCGSCLMEDKKLMFGMEGKNVVAYGLRGSTFPYSKNLPFLQSATQQQVAF